MAWWLRKHSMAEALARRVTRSASRASSASSDGVAGAAAGVASATSGAAEWHPAAPRLVLTDARAGLAPRFRGVTRAGSKFAAAIKARASLALELLSHSAITRASCAHAARQTNAQAGAL